MASPKVSQSQILDAAGQKARAAKCKANNLCYISLHQFTPDIVPVALNILGLGTVFVMPRFQA